MFRHLLIQISFTFAELLNSALTTHLPLFGGCGWSRTNSASASDLQSDGVTSFPTHPKFVAAVGILTPLL